jgi:hypothetical protein
MGKPAYQLTLGRRLDNLTTQIAMLRLQSRHLEGIYELRCQSEIRRLALREQAFRDRYLALTLEKSGILKDIKADIRALAAELLFAVDDLIWHLDSKSLSNFGSGEIACLGEAGPSQAPLEAAQGDRDGR